MWSYIFQVQTVTYDLPLKATASGTCVDQKSEINLVWSKGPANLTISMILDVQKEKWTVSSLGFTARTDNQPLVANTTGTCTAESSTRLKAREIIRIWTKCK